MSFGSLRAWITILCALLLFAGCGGGGGNDTTPPPGGNAFSLILSANPTVGKVGPAGLTVTFFVVASGGIAPYTYSWDIDNVAQTGIETASWQYTFATPGIHTVRVTVVDNNGTGDTVTASRPVTVSDDTTGPPADNIIIRFNASPQTGDLGFNCKFTSIVSGGKAPYSYQWDFDCDLSQYIDPTTGKFVAPVNPGEVPSTFVPDAFLQHPSWTYDKIGPLANAVPPDFTVYPVLRVTDGTGKVATNLDDLLDNFNQNNFTPDSIPDFKMAITVLPLGGGLTVAANANPLVGQAPLTVEFTGSVTGGSGEYEFMWDFGEGSPSGWSVSSVAAHTYLNPGDYPAFVTVRDTVSGQQASTSPLLVQATTQQQFSVRIVSDVGSHPGGYFDEIGETDGFGIPGGVKGNIAEGGVLWDEKHLWEADPPAADAAGRSCSDCHAGGIQTGRTFQQFAAVLRGTQHGDPGQEALAPNETDLSDAQIADLVAASNENNGFEFFVGEVPFVVNFGALPVNGQEPVVYQWDVFNEYGDPAFPPDIIDPVHPATPPVLDPTAVVTPDQSFRKNPAIHFASTGVTIQGDIPTPNDSKAYAVRCVARDAAGNVAVSNIVRVTANKHSANEYYFAHRPFVEFATYFPANLSPPGSANPLIAQISPSLWEPRANAAVCTHPTGISFIIGGEHLDENGDFVDLVQRTDAMYMYIPEQTGTGTGEARLGKFNTDPSTNETTDYDYPADAYYGRGGALVALTAGQGPSFPSTPNLSDMGVPQNPKRQSGYGWPKTGNDTRVPPDQEQDPDDIEPQAQVADRRPTSRSAPLTIVGSAAAILIHEAPETNPAGAYPAAGTVPPDFGGDFAPDQPDVGPNDADQDIAYTDPTIGIVRPYNPAAISDPDFPGTSGSRRLYAYPDSPFNPMNPGTKEWQIDAPFTPSPTPSTGLGSPVIYLIGGRTDASTAVDIVQKYHVYGFGTEDLIPWSIDYQFQTTGNQTDIWSNFFLREDTDQFVGPNSNFDPEVDDRRTGNAGGDSINLPRLPVPLYGLMAVKIETGVDIPSFDFPYGPYRSVFIFGGIDDTGAVRDEMRWWNVNITSDPNEDPGQDGVFSVVPDSRMPSPRAYGQAVFIPTNPFRVALVGGFDEQGVPLDTVDIYEFTSVYTPSQGGGWSTFAGTLPEALEACGAGYNPRAEPAESWVLAFGGWAGDAYNYRTYNARLRSAGDLVVSQSPVVVPRSHSGSSQTGAGALNITSFNRYFMFGGTDENGVDSIVEVFGLP